MEAYRTDEEQVEVLKNWWQENGTSILLTLSVALAAVFGWQTWKGNTAQNAVEASVQYQDLLDTFASGQQLSDNQTLSAQHLADQLIEKHGNSHYASYAKLLMAKAHVQRGELDKAEAQLNSALDGKISSDLQPLLRLRLARVLFAQDKTDAALQLITNVESGDFSAAYHELRGDMQQELGDMDAAVSSYEKALEGGRTETRNLIEMKLNSARVAADLGTPVAAKVGDTAADAAVEPSESAVTTEVAAPQQTIEGDAK